MLPIGIIPITEFGPCFGTPVFQDDDSNLYIQSSNEYELVDNLLFIGKSSHFNREIITVNKNVDIIPGDKLVFGYRDSDGIGYVTGREDMVAGLDLKFESYNEFPLFQLNIIRLSGKLKWVERISPVGHKKIFSYLQLDRKFSFDFQPNLPDRANKIIKEESNSSIYREFDAQKNLSVGDYFPDGFVLWEGFQFRLSASARFHKNLIVIAAIAIRIANEKKLRNSKELLFLIIMHLIELPSELTELRRG